MIRKLQVYVAEDCWSCEETRRIVAEVAPQFPDVQVEMLDTADTAVPREIFATPTYVLDGRIIYLGNPTREELRARLLPPTAF